MAYQLIMDYIMPKFDLFESIMIVIMTTFSMFHCTFFYL